MLSSVTYAFNVNGEKAGYVKSRMGIMQGIMKPQRGIRQDDPLSPYLFLFYTEGFSTLVQQVVYQKKHTRVKISRNDPEISHLFFTDDTLMFCEANVKEAWELRKILKTYVILF